MVRSALLGILGLITLTGVNCATISPGGTVCTDLYAYGVNASVTNASTGAAISNAVLTLQDTQSDYEEVMVPFPGGNDYVGAGERKGTYNLVATAPGFESKTIENIVVTADECHVQGVHVDVALQPIP